jgi:hypothetical protein
LRVLKENLLEALIFERKKFKFLQEWAMEGASYKIHYFQRCEDDVKKLVAGREFIRTCVPYWN